MSKKYLLKQEYVNGRLVWCAYEKGNIFTFFRDEYIEGSLEYSRNECVENLKKIIENNDFHCHTEEITL